MNMLTQVNTTVSNKTQYKTLAVDPSVWYILKRLVDITKKSQKEVIAEALSEKLEKYEVLEKKNIVNWVRNELGKTDRSNTYTPMTNFDQIETE